MVMARQELEGILRAPHCGTGNAALNGQPRLTIPTYFTAPSARDGTLDCCPAPRLLFSLKQTGSKLLYLLVFGQN
jgi:hypothetical protein